MVNIKQEIEGYENKRLPDTDILSTENDMRKVLQVFIKQVKNLQERVSLLEKK